MNTSNLMPDNRQIVPGAQELVDPAFATQQADIEPSYDADNSIVGATVLAMTGFPAIDTHCATSGAEQDCQDPVALAYDVRPDQQEHGLNTGIDTAANQGPTTEARRREPTAPAAAAKTQSTANFLLRDLTDRLTNINQDINDNIQESNDFANSPAGQALTKEQDHKIIKLLNVPFDATPTDLAACLRSHLPANAVIEINMQRGRKFGNNRGGCGRGRGRRLLSRTMLEPTLQNNGWALVTLSGLKAMETLITVANDYRRLELNGRTMRVQEGEIKNVSFSSYRHRDHSFMAQVVGLRLGVLPQGGATVPVPLPGSTFYSTNHVQLHISGVSKGTKQFMVTIGHPGTREHFRAELPLRTIFTPVLFTGRSVDGKRVSEPVLRLHLRRPPMIYAPRTQDPIGDNDWSGLIAALMGESHVTVDQVPNEIREPDYYRPVWESWSLLEELIEQSMMVEYETERSPDPTFPGACVEDGPLGQCFVWDFYLGQHVKQQQLTDVLRHAAKRPAPVFEGLPLDMTFGMEDDKCFKRDWADGFADCFQGMSSLPFSVTYLLHGLIACRNLWLSCKDDALQVATILKQGNPNLLARALAVQLALPAPRADSVQRLVDYIQSVFDNHHHGASSSLVSTFSDTPSASPNRIMTRSVIVTPLRVVPQLPEADTGNRILRTYAAHADRCIRVTFADEHMGTYKSMLHSKRMVKRRLKPVIHSPLIVGGRAFVFLAYGNSQLREGSCWFYDQSPRQDDTDACPTADQIRDSIGDLSQIRIPGKFAARLGQAFSSTVETVTLPAGKMVQEPDVERNGFCFSDGMGRISPQLAEAVADQLGMTQVPSAFQVRIAGCKGMLTVEPSLDGADQADVVVRPSMSKFPGRDHRTLEVCAVAKTYPCFLNRQLIVILTTLGVAESSIMSFMTAMMDQLDRLMQDESVAIKMYKDGSETGPVVAMLEAGFRISQDRHLREMLRSLRDRLLLDVKYRARLLIPQGVMLLGVLDEWDVLQEDEIWFASRSRFDLPPPGTKVLVGRSPCLHPGDLRVMYMARRPQHLAHKLDHLLDVVVFSQRGQRPVPNMCGGGDLDGDTYFVIWDPLLVPPTQFPPMDYTPPAPPIQSHGGVTAFDVAEFFVDYLVNEKLGVIANAHMAHADRLGTALDPICIQLAMLHSTAVDFAKTGVPVELPPNLVPDRYPDFMENPTRPMYTSTRLLGQIYRKAKAMVQSVGASEDLSRDDSSIFGDLETINGLDPAIPAHVPEHETFLDDAIQLMVEYSNDMLKAAVQYDVWSEADLVTGLVRKDNKKSARRRDRGQSGSEGLRAVTATMEYYRNLFWAEFEHEEHGPTPAVVGDEEDKLEMALRKRRRAKLVRDPNVRAKAVAWYVAAYSALDFDSAIDQGVYDPDEQSSGTGASGEKGRKKPQAFKAFLSFAWLVPEPLCGVKRDLLSLANPSK